MFLQYIKKGFIDGLKSLTIDLSPKRRNVAQKGGINRYWADVGQYMRHSMDELEQSEDYREAERYDAHHPREHEPKKELESI